MSMDKCRLHVLAHSLRHNSQFFGLLQPVASVRTRFHCFLFLAPTFCTPFSSSTGMRIPCRSGFFLSCHQSGWDSSTTIFPSVSLTNSTILNAEKKQKERLLKKREERKISEEKAAKRRAEKKAQLEKLTEDETFTISATGTDVKSVTQNLLAAVSGTSAPTGASFDIKA